MRKVILSLILAIFISGVVFAQTEAPPVQLSVGGGLYLGPALFVGDWSDYLPNMFGIGFFCFFDATFVEASLSMGWITGTQFGYRYTQFDFSFSVLGKYPFDLGAFTIFPLAGLGLRIPLGEWLDGTRIPSEYRMNPNLFLSFGGGADFNIAAVPGLFVRPSLLFNFNFRPFGDDFSDLSAMMCVMPILRVAAGFRF